MNHDITPESLAKEMQRLGYNAFQDLNLSYDFEDAVDLVDVLPILIIRHPDVNSPRDLAIKIGFRF